MSLFNSLFARNIQKIAVCTEIVIRVLGHIRIQFPGCTQVVLDIFFLWSCSNQISVLVFICGTRQGPRNFTDDFTGSKTFKYIFTHNRK